MELDLFVLDVDDLDFEIHPDGWEMGGLVVLLCESQEQIGLAHSTVAQNDILENVVGLLLQFSGPAH